MEFEDENKGLMAKLKIRFMLGVDTDPKDVTKMSEALLNDTPYCGRLLNYKKDGSHFWNLLTVSPTKYESDS
ncbi:hypothetical protein OROMI_019888 [Orobanche minor]